VHFDRGFCHELQDDLPRAIADYTDASRIDPELMDAVCARGQACQRTGDFRRAIADLDRCRTWRPDDPRAALSLAWLLATCPDAGLRDGRKALLLAGQLCDPLTCQTPETLTALAAACAELGEFARAQTLQERAVANSHFAPDFHQASARRLETIRRREPIREARLPLGVLPRPSQAVPRTITIEEAVSAPADVLGVRYLQARTLALMCTIARAGATIDAMLDEGPLTITSANADRVAQALDDRLVVFSKAIQRRGHARLAAGYRARVEGGCEAWGLDAAPVLVEQDGPDLHLSQGNVRHMGVVVESQVVFRHDTNTDIIITGRIDDGHLVFVTADRGGLGGSADGRCTLTLTPAEIAGPDWAAAFAGRADAFQSYGEYGRMLADLKRSLELQPQAAVAALRAYVLATCPDARVRDGRRAVAAAEEAGRLAAGTMDLMVQTCLAVAHAEAGDFAAAVRHQRKVVDLAPAEEKPGQRERLRLFESRRPFHEQRAF
jgi:tetratricopeptide (TPR) repeat protein